MKTQFSVEPIGSAAVEALIAVGLEAASSLAELNPPTGGWVDDAYASGEFKGSAYDTVVLHRPTGLKAKRLVLAGS